MGRRGCNTRRSSNAIEPQARRAALTALVLIALTNAAYPQRLPSGEDRSPTFIRGLGEFLKAHAVESAGASSGVQASRRDGPSGDWLARLITDLREQNELVGLGAIVMVDGQVIATAVDGERKIGSGVPVELGDRWHIGSVTKSVTATMIARLVESGKMQWSDSIGERFPNASVHDDWKGVSLQQLLTHTSGAPANFPIWVLLLRPAIGPECTQKRQEAVMNVIGQKPASPPGQKYAYSNIGYTIAGAMAETATGVSWEDLVKREVFEPLALTSAGFGPPKSPKETLDQPRGHLRTRDGKSSVSDNSDITPIIGPAGTIHMTLRDLSTYATEHLRGELGTGRLLSTETYKRLHTPNLENYAYGWVKKEPTDDLPYTTYWHNGSNTMWYALVEFLPNKNMTVAVTSNDGDVRRAESAAWTIVRASANQFNCQSDSGCRKLLRPAE
jgi:CubicO group peptidase (beta-lactamase class C family)